VDATDEQQDEYLAARREEAVRLGLTPRQARVFAESDATLHELRELIEKGADPSVAWDILV
jgi:hypothetical protein